MVVSSIEVLNDDRLPRLRDCVMLQLAPDEFPCTESWLCIHRSIAKTEYETCIL